MELRRLRRMMVSQYTGKQGRWQEAAEKSQEKPFSRARQSRRFRSFCKITFREKERNRL